MAEATFNAGISGRNVVAAPHASHGGTNNFYFANDGASKPCKPFSTVPFRPDPDFVERPSIMAWLRDKCSQPASRAALVGLGGIGKSQLAVHFAHEIRQSSPNTYIFWVHTSNQVRFEEAYRSIAERLQLPRLSDPNVNVLQLVYDWLCTEENGKWLMVLDNADDADVFYPTPNSVTSTAQRPLASFLPQSSNGMILVTSRNQDVAERLTGSGRSVLSIKGMDEHQAQQLLRNKLQESYDEAAAPDLLEALEYMPLAITQAAAYILQRGPRMSTAVYLDEFRRSEKRKASLLSRNMGDLRRDPSASNSIVITWQMTFDKIRQERQSAADLLVFMSFFDPQGIPEWVLRSYQHEKKSECNANIQNSIQENQDDSSDDSENDSEYDNEDDDFDDDLDMLRLSSLVAVTTQEGVLKMHALVQFCTRLWLSSFDKTRTWKRKFLRVLSKNYPMATPENWAKCRQLDPHVEMVCDNKSKNKENAEDLAQLLTNAGVYQYHTGSYEVARRRLTWAVEIRQKALGAAHYDTLTSINDLAMILQQQGKYKEAEKMHRHVLNSRKKLLGEKNSATLISLTNLAITLNYQAKYKEAEQLSRQSVDGSETVLGKDHPLTLKLGNNLTVVLCAQKKYKEAEQLDRRLTISGERLLGEEHPDMLFFMGNLTVILQYQGKYEEAERMERQVLDSKKKVFGEEHPETLTSMGNLALGLQMQRRYDEAEQMQRQTLDIRKKSLGEEHPSTLTSMGNLALVLQMQGRYDEAEQMQRQTLDIRKKSLGEEHPDTLASMSNLAVVLRSRGRYEDAEQMDRHTLDIRKKVLGEEHPDTHIGMGNLAVVLQMQGRYEEAEQMQRHTLDIRKKVLGEEHLDTLLSMGNLAVVLQDQEKFEEAEQMQRHTLDIRKKVLGEEHLDTLLSMGNLAVVL
ncbi:TPR domain protein (kinesin light chain) [Colletotrichum truncatum]|uniref:TPR domain protein (Kinesin light chain) n=1 Tax=Colletotrichum truncatum TaxID=5467 RepID=A0ACC3YFJ7_COLTU|nr:TPR domain protein (kinesin light chain) [Colletotrichum truncatum]KAF6788337.1 TPR domain protein (kinesin light chain) [Colletotrichum truncatum]